MRTANRNKAHLHHTVEEQKMGQGRGEVAGGIVRRGGRGNFGQYVKINK